MDLTAHRRRTHKSVISDSLSELYPHDLTLYTDPPTSNIALQEFESVALERLQLHRIIEQASLKGHKQYSDDWKTCIKEDLAKGGLKKYLRLLGGSASHASKEVLSARRSDHISHYVLRLAYCRSEELRRWFLNREVEWFHLRFLVQTDESIKHFLQLNNLVYVPIASEDKEQLRDILIGSTVGLSGFAVDKCEFYKVPFVEVTSLVKSRRVFLRDGFAYIPSSELVVCIQSKFRSSLSEALNVYFRRLPYFDDDRINALLSNMNNLHTGKNYYTVATDKDQLNPANLDAYSKKHFPPCMRHIHDVLRANHHLKHSCRLQYGLFLKAIGLAYEDALRFWQDEFTKKMDLNKFEKSYVYNIKHMYGKVGKMVSYTPYSCVKIIMQNVGVGEQHGCPFKHWDSGLVKQKSIEHGISSDIANEIKELAANGHCQMACGKYFEGMHGRAPSSGINHPNQYFDESMALEKEAAIPGSETRTQ